MEGKKKITSGAREAGKATVKDSAKAGESKQIEAKAVVAAAKPTNPFAIDSIKSFLLFSCNLDDSANLTLSEAQ